MRCPAASCPPSLYGTVVQNGTPVPGAAFGAAISVDLSYQPSQVEHQVGRLPGIASYSASTWLSLVPLSTTTQPGLQPALPGAGLGSFEIPMVLRGYPASPALVAQSGTATHPEATDVALLSEWTYGFTYTLPVHYPQDTVHATVVFNVAQTPAAEALLADSFAAMAEFVTVFPGVNADLQEALPQLTPASTAGSPAVTKAARAIGAVNDMLDSITGRANPAAAGQSRFTVRDRDASLVSTTETTWAFSVQEESGTAGATAGALIVTVLPASGPVPVVQIAGYTAQPYTSASFGYRAADVAFPSPLQPTLTSSIPVDLASVGSDSPATRPLDGHLAALFGALAGPGLPPQVELQLAITYSYTVNPRLGVPPLTVCVPVLFQPPTTVAWQGGGG